jgi:hypothetical protein
MPSDAIEKHDTVTLTRSAYERLVRQDEKVLVLQSQINKLANFIMAHVEGEPSQSEGAVDTAIRLLVAYNQQAQQVAGYQEALEKIQAMYHPDYETNGTLELAYRIAEQALAQTAEPAVCVDPVHITQASQNWYQGNFCPFCGRRLEAEGG